MKLENQEFHSDQDIRIPNRRCAAIISRGESVLLMYRKKDGKEFYVLVGGHMQEGESPPDTVIREVKEETSIEVDNLRPAFDFYDHIKNNIDYYFICEYKSGEVELGHDEKLKNNAENVYDLQWRNLSEVEDLNLLPKTAKEWIQETLVEGRESYL